MSMFVSIVRLTPAAFEIVKQDPQLLEGVFFDEDDTVMARLGISEADTAGFDYTSADAMMDAVANLDDDEDDDEDDDDDATDDDEQIDDAVFKELGVDGALDFDAGYGNAFTLSPKAVKQAATNSSILELDQDVKKLFQHAAKRGDYVVGVIS